MEWGPMASYWVWGPCSQMPKWHRRFQLLPDLCQRTHALRRGIVHYLNRHGTFFVGHLGRNDRTGCRQRGVQHRSNKRLLGEIGRASRREREERWVGGGTVQRTKKKEGGFRIRVPERNR